VITRAITRAEARHLNFDRGPRRGESMRSGDAAAEDARLVV